MRGGKRCEQEVLGGLRVSGRTEEKIEGVALRINGSVEREPFFFSVDGRLIDTPGIVCCLEVWPASPLQFGPLVLNPARDGGMVHPQAAFEHHLFQIPGTE